MRKRYFLRVMIQLGVVPEKIGGHGECYGGNNTKRNEVPERAVRR